VRWRAQPLLGASVEDTDATERIVLAAHQYPAVAPQWVLHQEGDPAALLHLWRGELALVCLFVCLFVRQFSFVKRSRFSRFGLVLIASATPKSDLNEQ
jgi:hypothetical protein